jgi:dTMP kinase
MADGGRGRFITLEGGEGAGKSTQIRLLAVHLRARGIEVVTTREPGGSPGAEAIRGLLVSGDTGRWRPLTEALLLNAARHEHLHATILPALERGAWVLCDRFADSTFAYQGAGHGLNTSPLKTLHALTVGDVRPDLTLILDLPPEAGIARTRGRGGAEDRYERMDLSFHERLRQGFLAVAAAEPERCLVIDATQPLEAVQAAIRTELDRRLGASP